MDCRFADPASTLIAIVLAANRAMARLLSSLTLGIFSKRAFCEPCGVWHRQASFRLALGC